MRIFAVLLLSASLFAQFPAIHRDTLHLKPTDVLATANEWIALPDIHASDGSLESFNVLSMRDRGLLEVRGANAPVLQPYITVDDQPLPIENPQWELIEYWIPVAHVSADGLEATLTYCAPQGSRAAFVHMTLTNRRNAPVKAALGMTASWGTLNRVTYTPVALRGERTMVEAPWVEPGETFSFITSDTHYAWTLLFPNGSATLTGPPTETAPGLNAKRDVTIAPGATMSADFILSGAVEEFSSAHYARPLKELIDRYGADEVIRRAADWCRQRTRTTGQPDLDLLMNRNFLFTALYAWGNAIDTEQFVGVTSRSPRYYVSAAYWDRDAMLWSFPALLDIDPALAKQALEYALTTQLRNTGTHSRFIDGVVLEDGFQLDEAVAPILALGEYARRTNDDAFVAAHRDAIAFLRDRLFSRYDAQFGLYSSLQDSQDEYQKLPFITYDNVLSWRALLDLSDIAQRLKDPTAARDLSQRAAALKQSILKYCVSSNAPGASGPIFGSATDGKTAVFTEIPPGSLMKLPALGFVPENDPVFARTYDWLHSPNYQYSHSNEPYGLPGSYRLPFTTSWSVADHLRLAKGREQALKILKASSWDAGIITEGVNSHTAVMDSAGRAFATAAGYVAHAICEAYCTDKPTQK